MHAVTRTARGTELSTLSEHLEGRSRERLVFPTSIIRVSPDNGHIIIDGSAYEGTHFSIRQLCRFADVPGGWALRSPDEKVAEAINIGLERSRTEEIAVVIENDRAVSFLLPKQVNPITEEVVPEIESLIEKDGFTLDRWCEVSEGHFIRLLHPDRQTQVREGDVVRTGLDFLSFENAKTGLRAHGILYRLVCSNGAVAGEMDEDTTLIKGLVPIESAHDQIRAALMTVDSLVANAEATAANLARLRDVPLVFESEMDWNALLKWLHVSQRDREDLMFTLQEEEPTLYGLYNALTRMGRDEEDLISSLRLEAAGYSLAAHPVLARDTLAIW